MVESHLLLVEKRAIEIRFLVSLRRKGWFGSRCRLGLGDRWLGIVTPIVDAFCKAFPIEVRGFGWSRLLWADSRCREDIGILDNVGRDLQIGVLEIKSLFERSLRQKGRGIDVFPLVPQGVRRAAEPRVLKKRYGFRLETRAQRIEAEVAEVRRLGAHFEVDRRRGVKYVSSVQ